MPSSSTVLLTFGKPTTTNKFDPPNPSSYLMLMKKKDWWEDWHGIESFCVYLMDLFLMHSLCVCFFVRYQFIPQLLFLNALFGYLSFLIILKWCQGSKPDLYHVMIYMFLSPTDDLGENQLFWGQRPVQVFFFFFFFFPLSLNFMFFTWSLFVIASIYAQECLNPFRSLQVCYLFFQCLFLGQGICFRQYF
jgi:hypothetical protein